MIDTKDGMLRSVNRYVSRFANSKAKRKQLDHILQSMDKVDRKYFCPYSPYSDTAHSIGYDQTISQPSTVAAMLLLADLKEGIRVLELGSGSGWNAALIADICYPGKVDSTEIVPELTQLSISNLDHFIRSLAPEEAGRFNNITFSCINVFNEMMNWSEQYDRIIVTAGMLEKDADKVDQMAKYLLNDGGMLICPRTIGPLTIIRRSGDKFTKEYSAEEYGFVPLYT